MSNPYHYDNLMKSHPGLKTLTINSTNYIKQLIPLSLDPFKVILDYGCGSGEFFNEHYLQEAKQGGILSIYGVDSSPSTVHYANSFANSKNPKRIVDQFSVGNIMEIYSTPNSNFKFQPDFYEYIFCSCVLNYIEDFEDFLTRMYYYLYPTNGTLCLTIPLAAEHEIPNLVFSRPKWATEAKKRKTKIAEWSYASYPLQDGRRQLNPGKIAQQLLQSLTKVGFGNSHFRTCLMTEYMAFPTIDHLCQYLTITSDALTSIPEAYRRDEMLNDIKVEALEFYARQGLQGPPFTIQLCYANIVAVKGERAKRPLFMPSMSTSSFCTSPPVVTAYDWGSEPSVDTTWGNETDNSQCELINICNLQPV